MDSTETIIARLVLGYLKCQNSRSAYKEFLRTSKVLQDSGLSNTKYLPTRFVGLTLEDILSEYFEMYRIVQGRLEATSYYNEHHQKNTLVDQLLYLLCKMQLSRTSTPCPRSPSGLHMYDTSPSQVEQTSDVDTTPAHTLPGNVKCSSEGYYKTPRKNIHSKFSKSDSNVNIKVTDKDDMSEVLAQTLLENKEFHEKIAQTINKVAEKQYKVSGELDKTIKTVVKETEEDPIFDKILDEIIGSTGLVDNNKIAESSSTSSSTAKGASNKFGGRKKIHKYSDNCEVSHEEIHQFYSDLKKVEEQNNEAIRSIIANSKSANTQTENEKSEANNEVIVFDGSLDKYLTSNTCNTNKQTQPVQNSLYISASSLVMVPSTVTTTISNLQIDDSKQYYLMNKQPIVGWNVPAITTPRIITEQDILTMPTVIVNDDRNKSVTTHSLLQTPAFKTKNNCSLNLPHILPKPIIEIPDYSMDCPEEPQQVGLKKVIYPTTSKKSEFDDIIQTDSLNLPKNTANEISSTKPPNDQTKISTVDSLQCKSDSLKPKELVKKEPPSRTPPPSEPSSKSTPKSASHIRNLDFSSPPKITSSPKLLKSKHGNKSTSLPKKSATKKLFESGDKIEKKTYDTESLENKNKSTSTWDADLRAIIPSVVKTKGPIERRKSCSDPGKVKKESKKKEKKTKKGIKQFDTTDHEGALVEAALKTPIKENNELGDLKSKSNIIKGCRDTGDIVASEQQRESETEETKADDLEGDKQLNAGTTVRKANKLILSPSKFNANKRNIVNTDLNSSNENKFITPEISRDHCHHPIFSNRNLIPMLDTPLKNDHPPKTPGSQTPTDPSMDHNLSMSSNIFTPFTKMLEANLKGIDINSLPTPSIPITPNFPPFTPTIDLISPYSNRPTDYSTSSSYYQPSDSEQNRSLEANLMELEKNPIKIHSEISVVKDDRRVSLTNKVNSTKKDEDNSPQLTIVNEHLHMFNKNVIGKKNLSLMKRAASSDSSSSDSVSDNNTSSDDKNDISWIDKESNDTVIFKKKIPETPRRTYSLRTRPTTVNNKESLKKSEVKETKVVKKTSPGDTKNNEKPLSKTNKQHKVEKLDDKKQIDEQQSRNVETKKPPEFSAIQQSVLKELEEKRLRTIHKVKVELKKTSGKQNGKFMKIKPIQDIASKRKPRKHNSPKKTDHGRNVAQKVPASGKGDVKNLSGNKNKVKGTLKTTKKSKASSASTEKSDKSASDVEAQNLIEGLKERGIHLMHNKSPNKKNSVVLPDLKTSPTDAETVKDDLAKNNTDNTSYTKETEISTSSIEYQFRDIYDNWSLEGETRHIIFDESKNVTKTLEDFDIKVLQKKFEAKVFVEEIDRELDIQLRFTPFYSLLDIPAASDGHQEITNEIKANEKLIKSKVELHTPKECFIKDLSNSATPDESVRSDDDLMNYALTGRELTASPESPKKYKKKENTT